MKKLFWLLMVCVSFIGCKSNEQRAKDAVKNYLFTKLNNFKSYEPVEWTKVDSSFTNYSKTANGIRYRLHFGDTVYKYEAWVEHGTALKNWMDEEMKAPPLTMYVDHQRILDSVKLSRDILDSINAYSATYFRIEKNIEMADSINKPTFTGYTIEHSFRAINEDGHTQLCYYLFYLDKKFNCETSLSEERFGFYK